MSREQRRVKSTKLSFENEKENTSGSDLESLLVSSIRYDNQNPMQIVESQGYEVRSKPSQGQQSQIKRQYFSNVYIEESSESRCQLCQRKIDAINENVSLISLKLQELESKLSLCFGKYGKAQTKLGELDLFIEQFKYFEKQNEERLKELSCSLATLEEENRFRFKESAGEQHRIKASISRLESKETEKLCLESKMVAHRLEKFKDEQELKLSEIVQTLERMGNLQRKMLQPQKSEDTTLFLEEPVKKKYFRTYSICEKNRTNESTNISYSRNHEFHK